MISNCKTNLANPHKKCIRQLIDCLTVLDNEFQRINTELSNIQKEFKQTIDFVIFKCSERRKLASGSGERLDEFQRNVDSIDTIKECFTKRNEDIQMKRQKIVDESQKRFEQLHIEKMKLNQFHQSTINYLKGFAVTSNDSTVVRNCEKYLTEINKQFGKEISFITKCENTLISFFHLVHRRESHMYKNYCFNEFELVPEGKSTKIGDTIAEEIKVSMGNVLRKAFAHLYIQQPSDRKLFLAQYLMSVKCKDEMMKDKFERFTTK